MGNLTFHRNINEITDPSLVPEKTDTYQPLPNEDFIQLIDKMVDKAGLNIVDRKFKTNKKKTQVFGTFELNDKEGDFSTQVGMINSYDKSRCAALAIGAKVHLCDNLSFSSFKAFRMHRGKNFWKDIREILWKASDRLTEGKENIRERYSQLESVPLGNHDIKWVVGSLLCDNIIGHNQVSKLKRTLVGEEEYEFGTDNWYDLNMHLTEVLKSSHPYHIVDAHMEAENYLVKLCKVKLRNKGLFEKANFLVGPLEGEDLIMN